MKSAITAVATVHESYSVYRGVEIAGFIGCSSAGWSFSRDGLMWSAASSSTPTAVIPFPRGDYRLVEDSAAPAEMVV